MPDTRPRIAVVTPYWPFPNEPHRGQTAFQTLRLLTARANFHVFCPVPIYPKGLSPRTFLYQPAPAGFSPGGITTTYVEYPAVPFFTRSLNGWTITRKVLPLLRSFSPRLILNYWLYPEGYAAVSAARTLGARSALCAIGTDLKGIPDPLVRRLTRTAVSHADFFFTVSEDLRQDALRLGASAERSAVVPNGCDTSIFSPIDQAQARGDLGISADDTLIVFVGWVAEGKGVRELFTAVDRLAPRFPRIRAVLIGEGPLRNSGLASPRIHFAGRQDSHAVARWMSAADLFCLPSHSEGCPNVIVESLATGCPVVATTVGGIPDLIDSSCGVLVPPRDPAALAEGLASALDRDWDRAAIANGHRRSWYDAAEDTWRIFESVLGQP